MELLELANDCKAWDHKQEVPYVHLTRIQSQGMNSTHKFSLFFFLQIWDFSSSNQKVRI